jgi:hypothetical protein
MTDTLTIECPHARLGELPLYTVRRLKTSGWVSVGDVLETESMPEGAKVMQCFDCKAVLISHMPTGTGKFIGNSVGTGGGE